MSEPALESILEIAQEAAFAAGRRTLGWFGAAAAEMKADGTPVTPADRESEATLRRIIDDNQVSDAQMPPLASEQPDEVGATTVSAWITSLLPP